MAKRKVKVQRAKVERSGDVGMDLPAGATAAELGPGDYHPVEMEPPEHVVHGEKTHVAEIERPGDVGLDLPAGSTAAELRPSDYHPIDMEPPVERPPRERKQPAHH